MRRGLTTVVVVATATVMPAAIATAGPSAAKQRVAIRDSAAGFVLTPLTTGTVKADAGSATFCCWTSHVITRDGQRIEVTNGPTMTLVGKRGTLEVRNRTEWLDVSGGYQLFTGTWTVVRGTGAYAGLAGGGRVAGIKFPNGDARWRREGLLGAK